MRVPIETTWQISWSNWIGPEPACGNSVGVDKKRGQGVDNQRPQETLGFHKWTQTGKGLTQGPSAIKTRELLKLNRNQLQRVVGLLTGHYHLKGHLFILGLTNSPMCKRFLEEGESATHILM
jgi:hypothetical protein